ncbi:hypothetical protein [Helicobacter sp.]|uniref:hypothetical protein n=1 Tax=Helicobacter sp. TaxID=218 RepID=UPI002A90BE7D|nr:hypothetical protein [Helicobacter sp.]MDY5556247.1 hypothetical protein [Helicobacter sp.]
MSCKSINAVLKIYNGIVKETQKILNLFFLRGQGVLLAKRPPYPLKPPTPSTLFHAFVESQLRNDEFFSTLFVESQ